MELIKSLDRFLEKIEGRLIVVLLSVMIILSFGQMVSRNIFHQSLVWGDTLLRQLVLWTGFLGASLAVHKNKHISIDVFSNFMSPALKGKVLIFTHFITAVISGFLAWAAWSFMQFERESESTLFLDIPVWIFQFILPYSFLIIAFRFLLKSVDSKKSESTQINP
ncbi:MAG: TRAP transporter small permease [Nitrospina sp.]|jgi:TRAP-type C4-dicarboxylate transport system permease small subunit|nr:TRAP transporter small permease [Nitrospina sp.]